MKYGHLAPSISSDEPNPEIRFHDSPFYLQHGLSPWPAPAQGPRRALVNSFGAGGVNACVVVEQYAEDGRTGSEQAGGPYLFTLSARNVERLEEYVHRFADHLQGHPDVDLASLCYTLQTGREAMEERLAIVATGVEELVERLSGWNSPESSRNVCRGKADVRGSKPRLSSEANLEACDLNQLAAAWVGGRELNWGALYPGRKPRPMSLPPYPFARERYWISDSVFREELLGQEGQLHPLISYNSSTLREVSFISTLSNAAFYAKDHKVNEEMVLPGAAFLEMACVSGNLAGEQRVRKIKDIVWMQPLFFGKSHPTLRTVLKQADDDIAYAISSSGEDNEPIVHSEGTLTFWDGSPAPVADDQMPIHALKAQCKLLEPGSALYGESRKFGIEYGPGFQTVQEVYAGPSFVLSKLRIPDHMKGEFGQFILHPSIIDGAFQTIAGLAARADTPKLQLPFALDEVEILHPVRQTCYVYAEFGDSCTQPEAGVTKFHIRLLNEAGDTLVKFTNVYVRTILEPLALQGPAQPIGPVLKSPAGRF
jgi:acyl transferase domain-containing protein